MKKNNFIKEIAKDFIFESMLIACTVNASPIAYSCIPEVYNNKINETIELINRKEAENKLELKVNDEIKYLSSEEIDNYIDFVYKRVKLPRYITKDYIKKLLYIESEWGSNNVSELGAKGLGQLMKETWYSYEKNVSYEEGVFDPEKNLEITLKHLKWQHMCLRKYNPKWKDLSDEEKLDLHSAAYNAGINRLEKNNWSIDGNLSYETRNHVRKIKSNF